MEYKQFIAAAPLFFVYNTVKTSLGGGFLEAYITPALIVSVVLILFFSVFSSRRSRRLDSGNPPGLFKPKDAVRFIQTVLLLGFCAAGFLSARRSLDAPVGLALMALLFIAWIPFQFWQHARVLAHDEGIVLSGMWGRVAELRWQDVRAVRLVSGSVVLAAENGELRIPGYFARQEKLLEIIRQRVPGKEE